MTIYIVCLYCHLYPRQPKIYTFIYIYSIYTAKTGNKQIAYQLLQIDEKIVIYTYITYIHHGFIHTLQNAQYNSEIN